MLCFRPLQFYAALLSLASLPAIAAEQSYVVCDNGLRCIKAPCPSNSALEIATGKIVKGVSIHTSSLPEEDKAALDLSDKLYAGKVVVRGSIETSRTTIAGKAYDLPYLVVSAVERQAKASERRHCSAR